MTTTENSRDALTDEQIINIAEKHHASHPGVDEWWAFRDRADVIAFGRAILAADPVEKPAAAPIPTDDLEQMTPNQRRALNKGLAALETMADLWAVETRLTDMSERIAAVADEVERAKRIAAMIHLGFVEGAYRHFLDHKDSQTAPAPSPADERAAEHVTAIQKIIDIADGFNVSGVYLNEDVENRSAIEAAENALEALRIDLWSLRVSFLKGCEEIDAIRNALDLEEDCDYGEIIEAIEELQGARAASANETGAEAKRGTDAQILFERKLTCEAIDGAIAFGYQNTNPPPSEDHWLAPFWRMGRKLAAIEAQADETGLKLDKPAKVGGGRFGVGVKWSTVIGAAQRLYEYEVTPEKEAARIERARVVLDDIRNGKYASEPVDAAASELEAHKRMLGEACRDLGLIHEALGLDPDEAGGAAPILDAIAILKRGNPSIEMIRLLDFFAGEAAYDGEYSNSTKEEFEANREKAMQLIDEAGADARSPAMAAEADDDAPDIATFCELLGSYGRVMSSRDFPNDERYAAREDVINAYRAALRETAGDAPATSAEAVAIHQAIHQVWIEETSSWADVTPAYYAERQPSNRRRVYYAPQPPAQADAIAEIDPPQAGGNKGRLPALARTREGHNLYSLGYNRGLKKGRDEPAQADAREGLTEQAITDAVKKWFPDRAYQAPFFARALLNGANR